MEVARALWEGRGGTQFNLSLERKWGPSGQRGEGRIVEGGGTASAEAWHKAEPGSPWGTVDWSAGQRWRVPSGPRRLRAGRRGAGPALGTGRPSRGLWRARWSGRREARGPGWGRGSGGSKQAGGEAALGPDLGAGQEETGRRHRGLRDWQAAGGKREAWMVPRGLAG